MKKNKGFTLIEIIICIVLVGLIGGTSIVLVNRKNNNDINQIEKRILEAAQVYVEVEKDSNGKDYLKEISNGKKGLKIPFKTLVNDGYIKEDEVDIVYEENKDKLDNKDFYVLLLAEGGDACSNSELQYTLSYTIDTSNPVYLCESVTPSGGRDGSDGDEESNSFIEKLKSKGYIKLEEDITEDDFNVIETEPGVLCNTTSDSTCWNYTRMYFSSPITQGLYTVDERDYYYRGSVKDNYLVIKNKDNVDFLFRIVSFNSVNNEIKLVLEDSIEYTGDFVNFQDKFIKNFITTDPVSHFANERYIKLLDGKILKREYFRSEYLLKDEYSYSFRLLSRNTLNEEYDVLYDDYCSYCYVNFLSILDFLRAGVMPYVSFFYNKYFNTSGRFNIPGTEILYNSYWVSDSYLTTGGNTITQFKIDANNDGTPAYPVYFYSNSKNIVEPGLLDTDNPSGSYYWKGLLTTGPSTTSIRPVIILDGNHVVFSGEGTEYNPFVISNSD